jgi:hypothetical protein
MINLENILFLQWNNISPKGLILYIMNITFNNNKIHAIRSESSDFTISDGIVIANRASIEITADCPDNMRNTLAFACSQGWITPVAHITEREMIFMGLTKP